MSQHVDMMSKPVELEPAELNTAQHADTAQLELVEVEPDESEPVKLELVEVESAKSELVECIFHTV